MKNPFCPFSIETPGSTSLKSLEGIYYRNNFGSYRKFKKLLLILSIFFSVVCVVIIIFSEGWVQSLFATLFGGALSSIVWWISVFLSDERAYRINKIDCVLFRTDKLLSEIRYINSYFIYGMEIMPVNPNDLKYRMLHLLQVVSNLQSEKEIDSSDLKLTWIDGRDMFVGDFMTRLYNMLNNEQLSEICKKYTAEQLGNFVSRNERNIDTNLSGLKNCLIKRREYVLLGGAPLPPDKAQSRIKKAEMFNKIFNHHKNK